MRVNEGINTHSPVNELDTRHVSYTEAIGGLTQEGRNIFSFLFCRAYWMKKRTIKEV